MAQYDVDDNMGPSARIGTTRYIENVPQCLMDYEIGVENRMVWSWIHVREPELPLGGEEKKADGIAPGVATKGRDKTKLAVLNHHGIT